MKTWLVKFFYFCVLVVVLSACEKKQNNVLRIAATSIPHAEILESLQPLLKKKDLHLEIVVMDDFNLPNRALADREVEANYFQHRPFLEAQQADFGYELESLVAIHLEPMALYSKRFSSLIQLPEGAKIAVPSDPANQARALVLCAQAGLITLKQKNTKTSVLDITDNPKKIEFLEIDSPLLSRTLDDVDAAAITTNFALLAGLSPQKDALAIENGQSEFVNLIVIRKGEGQNVLFQKLKEAATSEDVRTFIQEHYQGAVIPIF